MSVLVWDAIGEHLYETGVDHGVFFPQTDNGAYGQGVVWNGLIEVSENPSGAEATAIYADNIKYLSLRSAEEFGATVQAYTYPKEFAECDGSAFPATGVRVGQQKRKPFGFSYRTLVGNDVKGEDLGYKIHLVYGATASPSERTYSTINDSPEAIQFSWEFDTVPVAVPGFKPTSVIEIDSTTVDAEKLAAFEAVLYGSENAESRLPLPEEVINMFKDTTNTEPAG